MRTWGRGGALLLGAALGMMGCAEGAVGPGAPDGAAPDGPPSEGGTDGSSAPACAWDVVAPELKLPESDLQGVLRGSSRNASTTCTQQKATGGPEAFYLLRLSDRTLVDLEVISDVDTVLAIRRACDDQLTEVACSDGPGSDGLEMKVDAGVFAGPRPPGPVDAPVRMDPAATPGTRSIGGRDAHLRASLPAGTYFVLVDEAEPFGVGGNFQLRVRTSSAPAQTTCAGAPTVSDGTRLLSEELDLASEQPPCGGETARPALFYRAVIPAGARITARALPTSGDRPWTPALQLSTSCAAGGANLCLASDQAAPDGQRELRHVNNGPTEQALLLSVSATEAVAGALFRLEVNIAQPLQNFTCASAQPLTDGLVLHRQDLSDGRMNPSSPCASGAPALFYSARLYPRQWVRVTVLPADGSQFSMFPVMLGIRESCDSSSCQGGIVNDVAYTNASAEVRTVIIEASTFPGSMVPPFDLQVEMPLPSGEIAVRADGGLTTTEGGGQATFQVALTSPGTEMVEIPLASSDPEEGNVSPAVLRFSPADWDRPQTVTVTGVDDARRDGTRPYTVKVGPSTSADPRYQGVEGNTVALVNRDDEPGFRIEAPATLVTSEAGTSATFRVFLNRAPTATVHLPLSTGDETEGKVSSSEVVFEPGSWREPQTVTVLGVDDDQTDGSQPYQVVLGVASSDDAQYQGIDPADLLALNDDDDFHQVAPTVVNGSFPCSLQWNNQLLAVDQAGVLYASMSCRSLDPPSLPPDGGEPYSHTLWVAASADGGRTFGAPVDTRLPAFTAAIAAGRPGLVVAVGGSPGNVAITRSEDGGVTWQPTQLLGTTSPNSIALVYLAAAGERVLLEAAWGDSGFNWRLSEDGARTWSPFKGPDAPQAVGLDPDGTIWAVSLERDTQLFQSSRDGGLTFQRGALFPFDLRAVGAGLSILYHGSSNDLVAVPRDGLSMPKVVGTLPMSDYGYALAADHKDNVTVGALVKGQIQAYRLNAGDSALGAARVVGPGDGLPSMLALSDRAVAVLFSWQGKISVAVETWP